MSFKDYIDSKKKYLKKFNKMQIFYLKQKNFLILNKFFKK